MRLLYPTNREEITSTSNLLDMFASSANLHPAAIGYATGKKSHELHRQKHSPTRKRAMIRRNSQSCQVQLIRALQGIETDATIRHMVATTINELEMEEKPKFIEVLQDTLIPFAVENNACKTFECTCAELETALNDENVHCLTDLWSLTHTQIIPTLDAMLYPLKAFDSTFNVRKTILAAFRDLVLARVLRNVRSTLPSLQSMIFYISFATADNSEQYIAFSNIADKTLGLTEDEGESATINCSTTSDNDYRFIKPKPRIKQALSDSTYLRPPLSCEQKRRSTTLPTRSVHWADLQPTTPRKISLV